MVATRTQLKRFVVGSSSPLEDPHILKNVMSYVGPGHWLFLSAVSKAWLDIYSSLESVRMRRLDLQGRVKVFTCLARHTMCAAVFASASRVRPAHSCGLQLSNWRTCAPLQTELRAGKHADIETLVAAHDLGLPWSGSVLRGAAESGCFFKLQWLMDEKECFTPPDITTYAARSGSSEMLA
jgi:hypothetical protein